MKPPLPLGLWKSDLGGTVWPPVLSSGHAVLAALVAQLGVTERLPRAVIEEMQGRQLAALAAHHWAHTPSFADRLRKAALGPARLDCIERLRDLPPLRRRDLQNAGDELFCRFVPHEHLPVCTVQTSGSTGEPVVVRKTQLQQLLWSANNLREHVWNGGDFRGRLSLIRPQITSYFEREGWGWPVDDLFQSGPSQGIPITLDVEKQLRLLRRFRPDVLVLFPSNLRAFLRSWELHGFEPASLRQIKTVGETVSEDLRASVMRTAGLGILDQYSSQEAGPIALQCPESGLYHVMAESLIVEVLGPGGEPCREGETGRVVLTDLHNLATPLIRYEIGDRAEMGGECPCGRGLPTLHRILGRERNLMVLPDGSRHWPLVGFARFEEVAPVRQFQLIQHTLGSMELRVVTGGAPLTPGEGAGLQRIVQEALGHPFEVEVVWFRDSLPAAANGKLEEFLCRVEPESLH
jgi:phenylacetate-CoA ligase